MELLFLKEGRSVYGAEQATLTLLSALVHHTPCKASVIVREYEVSPSEFLQELESRGIPHQVCHSDRQWMRALVSTVNRTSPSAVVSVGYKSHLILAVAPTRKIPKIAILHGWVDTDLKLMLYNRLARFGLRSFRGVFRVADTIHVKHANVTTLPNAIEPERIEQALTDSDSASLLHHLPSQTPRFLFLGRLSPEKGCSELIRAFAAYRQRYPAKLICLGDGPLRHDLLSLSKTLGISDDLLMPGYCSNPIPFLAQADLLVLPSHTEGLPMCVLEAMYLRTPVAATPVGALPSLLGKNERGWLIPEPRAGAIMATLEQFTKTAPSQRLAMTEQARAYVLQNHTPEHLAQCFRNTLDQWLNGSHCEVLPDND
ncbi:MAG: glycosyltransferase [Lentisphaerae bacterium]|nr:MAG: glycosyltransferase [Lentisphaerota bacterium]